ncbi:uncharacterized protein EI90DRAFT_3058034 [Cantharellus anzutake]|uniref:uncharacterized protein n=1 Tax=Cantharellus anzutake TaxID=1750568 RepID=UPI00190579B4|nr:uncharacterized protein EI90DRAFT_3058034 [Cantharellus anzutake]KAF8331476.1 hypothetical protein EI90DRAFT_3058034 [Cantharellus anzutake]
MSSLVFLIDFAIFRHVCGHGGTSSRASQSPGFCCTLLLHRPLHGRASMLYWLFEMMFPIIRPIRASRETFASPRT